MFMLPAGTEVPPTSRCRYGTRRGKLWVFGHREVQSACQELKTRGFCHKLGRYAGEKRGGVWWGLRPIKLPPNQAAMAAQEIVMGRVPKMRSPGHAGTRD